MEQDRANQDASTGGLFRGCFKDRLPEVVIHDSADGVYRCPTCAWELERGWCQRCEREYDIGEDLVSITDLSDSGDSVSGESDDMEEYAPFVHESMGSGPWEDFSSPETDIDDISLDEERRSVHGYDLGLDVAFGRTAAQDLQQHQARRRAAHGGAHSYHERGRTPSILSTATTTDYSEASDTPHEGGERHADGLQGDGEVLPDLTDYSENSDDPETDLDGFIEDETETNAEDMSLRFSSDESSDGESAPAIQASRRPIVELSDSDEPRDKSDDITTARSNQSPGASPDAQSTEGENPSSSASDTSHPVNPANVSRKRRRIVTETASDEEGESDSATQRSYSRRRLSNDGSDTVGRQTPIQNRVPSQDSSTPRTQLRGTLSRPRTSGISYHRHSQRMPLRDEHHLHSRIIPPSDRENYNPYTTQPYEGASVFSNRRYAARTSNTRGQYSPQILCRHARGTQRSREGERLNSVVNGCSNVLTSVPLDH